LITEVETLRSIPIARKELVANLCLRIGELARACGNPDTERLVYERLSKTISELPVNEREVKEELAFNGGVISSAQGISSEC
jgi:hypothetical protein